MARRSLPVPASRFAVNVVDIPVIGIYGSVVHSAKKSIHSTELGSCCVLSPLATIIPPAIPFRGPRGPAIRGAVQHVVDIFEPPAPAAIFRWNKL